MNLYLTKGIFGSVLETLCTDVETFSNVNAIITTWKENPDNLKRYKIERYDRIIFHEDHTKLAIDFGDYFTFMLVDNVDKDTLKKEFNLQCT